MTSADVIPVSGERRAPVVLVVEDDVLIRFTVSEMLREEGYTVLEAVDAAEALTLIATGHPLDAMLSDVRMPGAMDGVALVETVKQLRTALPIALVSTHLPAGVKHLADAFLAKPFTHAKLITVVEGLVGVGWRTESGRSAS